MTEAILEPTKPGSASGSPTDWTAIRSQFEAGAGSLRSLARQHNIAFSPLQRRAKREQWADPRIESVQNQIISQAESLTPDSLISSTLEATKTWLNRLEIVAQQKGRKLSPKDAKDCTEALKNVIGLGRQALRLDEVDNSQRQVVQFNVIAGACELLAGQRSHTKVIDVASEVQGGGSGSP